MLIGHSRNNQPNSLSDYERTYNNAIDLVAEALGHAKKISSRVVAAIVLKPTKYKLFVEGMKYITAQQGHEWQEGTELTWEGVKVLEGPRGQSDSVKFEYVENAFKMPVKN
jgi:hypothetical protein